MRVGVPPPPASAGGHGVLDGQFSSIRSFSVSSSCLQVLCPGPCPVVKFLPSSCLQGLCPGPLPRSWPGSVLIPLLKSSPVARSFRRAGPKAIRALSVYRSKFQLISGSAFYRRLVDFGAPKAPKNGTKTYLFPPFFLSLFWLLFLTPNCTKK